MKKNKPWTLEYSPDFDNAGLNPYRAQPLNKTITGNIQYYHALGSKMGTVWMLLFVGAMEECVELSDKLQHDN